MRIFNRIAFIIVLCFLLTNIASSATKRSGGGNKKQTAGLNLNYKKSPLTLQNGFRFRGGLTFTSTESGSTMLHSGTTAIRYQKGNNLYVMPYKQKPFLSRFKTPQKEMR
jgi:hypothetical protein